MRRPALMITACLACLTLAGCLMSDDQLAGIRLAATQARAAAEVYRAEAGTVREEIVRLGEDYRAMAADAEQSAETRAAAARIAGEIEAQQAEFARWMAMADESAGVLDTSLAALEDAQDGWDIADAGLGALAAIVPGLAVVLPVFRRLRRNLDGTVAAIAAGGGPVDPAAARASMMAQPGVKAAVDQARGRVGDRA